MDAQDWDRRYGSLDSVWSREPNPQLIAEAGDLTPGTALDVGSGEGADAMWLAARGWEVSAVDYSRVAQERAGARAREIGVRVRWIHADVTTWVPAPAAFDLVSVQFLHLPQRGTVYSALAAGVAPGGVLLVVGHHPDDLATGVRRPSEPGLLFTPEEVVALLDPGGWVVETAQARPRSVDTADGPVTVQDSVVRARRRAPA